ncbi:MAG TPA: FHA domain-containing protein [Cellulomonas sp.]
MSACAYLPGTWTAVVCERLLALVGPGAGDRTVAALWDVAARGGGVVEALVELPDDAPGPFALVTLTRSGLLHAALRGDVEVSIATSSGMRSLRAGEESAWTEVTAHDVPAVTLRAVVGAAAAGAPAAGSALPLVGGVVRAAEVRATADLRGAPGALQDTPVCLEDHEGLTIVSGELARIRASVPPVALAPAHAVPSPAPARLVLSTGLVVPLDRTVLMGRAPQVGRVSAHDVPRLVTVPSPQLDISRTHARVRQEGEHVVVTDLDSLNGVRVARAGAPERRLHPGEPTVVAAGEVVDLGDGVTFTVEPGA